MGGCRRQAGIAAGSVGAHRCTGAVGRWIFERPWPQNALCTLRNPKAPLSPRAGLLHHAGPLQPGLRLPGATVVRRGDMQARLRVHLQCQLRVSHQRPNLRLHGQQMQGLHGEQPVFRCAAKGCMLQLRGAALPRALTSEWAGTTFVFTSQHSTRAAAKPNPRQGPTKPLLCLCCSRSATLGTPATAASACPPPTAARGATARSVQLAAGSPGQVAVQCVSPAVMRLWRPRLGRR